MAKPKSTVRKGVRIGKDGTPKVVVTKPGKGIVNKILKGLGK